MSMVGGSMVNFLDVSDSCMTVLGVIFFIRELLKYVLILIPIGLIVMFSIDFTRGVISTSDSGGKILGFVLRRIIYTMAVFLIPTMIFALFNILGMTSSDSESCWNYVNETSVSEIKQIIDDKQEAQEKENADIQQKLNKRLKKSSISEMVNKKTIVDNDSSSGDALSSNQSINGEEKIRLTSFSDSKLGTGISKSSGRVSKNKKGWYMFSENNKKYLVVAASTKELHRSSGWSSYTPKILFSYYDTMQLRIEGKNYNAIVLDSCGACMKYDKNKGIKLDLWTTSESQNFGDWQYIVSYK